MCVAFQSINCTFCRCRSRFFLKTHIMIVSKHFMLNKTTQNLNCSKQFENEIINRNVYMQHGQIDHIFRVFMMSTDKSAKKTCSFVLYVSENNMDFNDACFDQ